MKRKFLYMQITDDIREKIVTRYYKDGDVLENNSILMDRYQASIITINKALGLLVEQGYIKRIPGTGSIVQFTGDDSGTIQGKQATAPNIIGSIVADIAQSDMWAGVLKAIEDFLFPLQYHLMFGNSIGDSDRILDYIDQFYKQGVKGIVYVPISADTESAYYAINNTIISRMEHYGFRYIVLHNILKKGETVQVGFDNYHDSCRLTEALLETGCSNPILLSYTHYNSVLDERERGYRDTMLRYGFKDPVKKIIRLPRNVRNSNQQPNFIEILDGLLKEKPEVDAVVAVDEYYLKLLHKAVQSDNCCIDFGVLLSGFGKVEEIISTNSIAIYQLQNSATLGRIAIENLLKLINEKDYTANHIIRVPSELVVSSSSVKNQLVIES